jgi:hypothetical protein
MRVVGTLQDEVEWTLEVLDDKEFHSVPRFGRQPKTLENVWNEVTKRCGNTKPPSADLFWRTLIINCDDRERRTQGDDLYGKFTRDSGMTRTRSWKMSGPRTFLQTNKDGADTLTYLKRIYVRYTARKIYLCATQMSVGDLEQLKRRMDYLARMSLPRVKPPGASGRNTGEDY